MTQRLAHLRTTLERQHERLSWLARERTDLSGALTPVLEDVQSALQHLEVLERPEANHERSGDVAGSA